MACTTRKSAPTRAIAFHLQPYHPVREAITALRWDGKPRLEEMLIRYLGAPDTAYTREVSRLIFAGGIHRAFRPGCKFDVMPVLVGLRQGEGKSTFVRWLAMDDAFFREVTVLEGQKGSEAVEGAWICEMAELLALRRAKDAEAVKGFISRQSDSYRRPYQRHTEDVPRSCIYIGTTNRAEFLTDVTGNRRFYPITCRGEGSDLFAGRRRSGPTSANAGPRRTSDSELVVCRKLQIATSRRKRRRRGRQPRRRMSGGG